MTDRMIELQRAKMGLPPMSHSAPNHIAAGYGAIAASQPISASRSTSSIPVGSAGRYHTMQPITPQERERQEREAAAVELASEDERMRRFLHLLASSSDGADAEDEVQASSSFSFSSKTKPAQSREGATVPNSLSRRLLHRQGAGYLDEVVPTVASAAADRFLATVLQQAAACRDRRLKGEELARQREGRERRMRRKRRRQEAQARREAREEYLRRRRDAGMADVAAEAALKAAGAATATGVSGNQSGGNRGGAKGKSKKSKKAQGAVAAAGAPVASPAPGVTESHEDASKQQGKNGEKIPPEPNDLSEDSLDEEEDYYDNYYGKGGQDLEHDVDVDEDDGADEDDEDRYVLLLRDIARPLEAWGMTLTGKPSLGVRQALVGHDNTIDTEQNSLDVASSLNSSHVSGGLAVDMAHQGGDNTMSPVGASASSPIAGASGGVGRNSPSPSVQTKGDAASSESKRAGRSSPSPMPK